MLTIMLRKGRPIWECDIGGIGGQRQSGGPKRGPAIFSIDAGAQRAVGRCGSGLFPTAGGSWLQFLDFADYLFTDGAILVNLAAASGQTEANFPLAWAVLAFAFLGCSKFRH
jgi:hypothetical protein